MDIASCPTSLGTKRPHHFAAGILRDDDSVIGGDDTVRTRGFGRIVVRFRMTDIGVGPRYRITKFIRTQFSLAHKAAVPDGRAHVTHFLQILLFYAKQDANAGDLACTIICGH